MGKTNSMLILSTSPENVHRPYYFSSTRKRIYSLEELMYHCYYYWKQSIDDFLAGKFEMWITDDLNLPYLASQIEKIKSKEKTITAQFISFLNIIDYFEDNEINLITKEVYSWENMDQWRKFKEKGDYFLQIGNFSEAIRYYLEAIDINDDVSILNNLGIAYMRQFKYNDAMLCFQKAHFKEPYNEKIMINIVQLLMIKGEYETAEAQLQKFNFKKNSIDAYLLKGEIALIKKDYENALIFFKEANDLGDNFESNIKIANIYADLGEYKAAIIALENIEAKDNFEYAYYYSKLLFKIGKIKDAIAYAEQAVEFDKKNIDIWLLLVKLYKKNKNISLAERALLKVFEIDPENEEAKLEYATLKKSKGLIKDYQNILKGILNKWKQLYRESNN